MPGVDEAAATSYLFYGELSRQMKLRHFPERLVPDVRMFVRRYMFNEYKYEKVESIYPMSAQRSALS